MCLIAFAVAQRADYPLILLANRDEFFHRPTAPLQQWHDLPMIYGGRDLSAGGSWLAMHQSGRWAAVTNYRSGQAQPANRSRGELVTQLMDTQYPLSKLFNSIRQERFDYAGFNLIAGEANQSDVLYYANTQDTFMRLKAGVYAMSNGHLFDSWPKMTLWQNRLKPLINQRKIRVSELMSLAQAQQQFPVQQLPQTGVPKSLEQQLASPFIKPFELNNQHYGTRSTALILSQVDQSDFYEQTYSAAADQHRDDQANGSIEHINIQYSGIFDD